MDLLSILEVVLLIILFLVLVKLILNPTCFPQSWKEALKQQQITGKLKNYMQAFPDKQRALILWLQIKRIEENNIEGAFAELGVYKGDTARLIHHTAPDRKFYLFDTFEGYDEKDLEIEIGDAKKYSDSSFADTSVETVKQKILGNENIVFCAGYFPDTSQGLEEMKFAFVNMDVNLHKPTLAGLEFFYPRLSKGGVIIIHDYNNKWPMQKKAIDDFVESIQGSLILFPDRNNSVMIVKN